MKLFAFTGLLLFSFTLFADTPCSRNRSHCSQSASWTANGIVHAISEPIVHANENAGVYFARGSGSSCNAAFSDGLRNMMDNYDFLTCGGSSIRCGVNGAPYLYYQGCSREGSNYVAWVSCNNIFHGDPPSRPRQGTDGSGIVLLRSLQEAETRARASRGR